MLYRLSPEKFGQSVVALAHATSGPEEPDRSALLGALEALSRAAGKLSSTPAEEGAFGPRALILITGFHRKRPGACALVHRCA
jgi:hypothetical protein